jgi:hypothetical protein
MGVIIIAVFFCQFQDTSLLRVLLELPNTSTARPLPWAVGLTRRFAPHVLTHHLQTSCNPVPEMSSPARLASCRVWSVDGFPARARDYPTSPKHTNSKVLPTSSASLPTPFIECGAATYVCKSKLGHPICSRSVDHPLSSELLWDPSGLHPLSLPYPSLLLYTNPLPGKLPYTVTEHLYWPPESPFGKRQDLTASEGATAAGVGFRVPTPQLVHSLRLIATPSTGTGKKKSRTPKAARASDGIRWLGIEGQHPH